MPKFTHPTHKVTMMLPDNFTGGNYRTWRKATTDPQEGDTAEFWLRQWRGVVAVATFEGDAKITPEGDETPFAVMTWAVSTLASYMAPMLDPKA